MDCMARPGEIRTLDGVDAPAPLAPATAALVQSLADYESPVWLDAVFAAVPAVADWIRFHTGAPIVTDPRDAAFALIADARAPAGLRAIRARQRGISRPLDHADRADRTLCRRRLSPRRPRHQDRRAVLPPSRCRTISPHAWRDNRALFPRGIDLVLVAGRHDRGAAALGAHRGGALSHVCRGQRRRTRHRKRPRAARRRAARRPRRCRNSRSTRSTTNWRSASTG